ncbi:MAG: hypothetical protein FJ304_04275 [Planctomycetes bacterium]|nr:hypothetical protein [Planctomycetota bacterium]
MTARAEVLMVAVACAPAHAQPTLPGAPALPGGPTPAAAAAPAAGGGGAPRNIWSFFMKTPEQKAQCKANFCNSRIGLFVNNLLVPAGAATGGLLGPVCPPPGVGGAVGGAPNPDDLKKPATSPEGAAAKIKAEEAGAKAKVGAIEFLGTVNCRYYPEAEAGLIAGLRAEKNECVWIAAAKALATGCYSPKVVKALLTCVNCSNKDGFPAEASELVRTYAYVALERCLRKCAEEEPDAPPEPPPAAKKAMYEALVPMGATVDYSAHILLASYYPTEARETPAQVYAEGHRALARGLKVSPRTVERLSGPRNVADAVFPSGAREPVSLASITSFALPSLPSLPSFASIRAHAPPVAEPPARSVLPPPQLVVERPAPATQPARYVAPAAAVAQPVAQPAPPARTGRGNLMNIFQDGWKR